MQVLPRYSWFTHPVSLIGEQSCFLSVAMFWLFLKSRSEKEESTKQKWNSQNSLCYAILSKCQTWSEIIDYTISDLWLAFQKLNLWRIHQKWYWSQLLFTKNGFYYKNKDFCQSFSVAAAKPITEDETIQFNLSLRITMKSDHMKTYGNISSIVHLKKR